MLVLALACSGSDPADTDAEETDDTDVEITGPAKDCVDLGLPIRAWVEAEADPTLYATADDVTVETLDGTWSVRDTWSGCDTFLFVPEEPNQAAGLSPLWENKRDTEDFLEALPDNVHVVFVPSSRDEGERVAAVEALQADIVDIMSEWNGGDRGWFEPRIHYVTERDSEIFGWLGDTLSKPGWGAGIDRFQRVRYIGSFADPRRYEASIGWFADNLAMAANEPVYWNYEADRESRLEAEDALVVPVFGGEVIESGWGGPPGTAIVDLPADLSAYDTLELDLTMNCVGAGEYTECPAWDYLNYLYLCTDLDTEGCTCGGETCPEIGRYITTYHREGRWVHDVSPLLPFFAGGGKKKLAYYSIQAYETKLDLRFSTAGKAATPTEVQPLFYGGGFNAGYNDREPISVDVPAGVTKVELATVISGHGQEAPNNCAEFCGTEHHFTVNGTEFVRAIEEPGDNFGCMAQIDQGTVPNQFGTWWYGRNGWCPGKQVDMVTIDITDAVFPGQTNVFDYEAYQDGETPVNGNMDVTVWLSFQE